MRFITSYTTCNDESTVRFDWNDGFGLNSVTKYDYVANEKMRRQSLIWCLCRNICVKNWFIVKSNWNKINFQITYSFHQAFWWTAFRWKIAVPEFENKSTWRNYTNCVKTCRHPLIYKTSLKSTLSRCRWKNDCNERWKKRCHENEHTINSTSIETMNAARLLKKWKNCVKYSPIHKMKKIERLTFTRTITNRRSYTKQRFWNFGKRLIWMPRIKKNCEVWSDKPESKVMFWMNCWRCPRWLEACRKALTKNWQRSLKTKHGFWPMNFFRLHPRRTWVTFLAQRIRCWCTVQQSLWKKRGSRSWKNWIQTKRLNWMILSIDFWKLGKMAWSACWHHFFRRALVENIISRHIKKTTQWFCVNLIKTIMVLWKHNVQLFC